VCFLELLWFREKEGQLVMAQVPPLALSGTVMSLLAQERERAPLPSLMVNQVLGWVVQVCNQQQAVPAL
jgi:hypothetical protein